MSFMCSKNMNEMKRSDIPKDSSEWDAYYQETQTEKLPWYITNLDHDLDNEIKSRNLSKGRFLDLGTGPGTQASQLAKRGFDVTGADLSESAIEKAKKLSNEVNFVADDFLNSKLPDNGFDFIFDRGCFHLFDNSRRPNYLEQIKRILDKNGILFLKCMSIKEKELPKDDGPNRLSEQEIVDTFSNDFDIDIIKETFFDGTLDFKPKAWFVVLKKKF